MAPPMINRSFKPLNPPPRGRVFPDLRYELWSTFDMLYSGNASCACFNRPAGAKTILFALPVSGKRENGQMQYLKQPFVVFRPEGPYYAATKTPRRSGHCFERKEPYFSNQAGR